MLIFLEASHSALVRRFSETRRPHPLARDRSVSEGITEERGKLNQIRAMADLILDTSNLTVHELRDIFMQMSRDDRHRADMVVNLVSFGYKNGVPVDADLVFDVRCLPNPHFVDSLRKLTGRDAAVVRYMRKHQETHDFIDRPNDQRDRSDHAESRPPMPDWMQRPSNRRDHKPHGQWDVRELSDDNLTRFAITKGPLERAVHG